MKMFSLNNSVRHLNIKDPPIGIYYLYSCFTSFNIYSRSALFVSPDVPAALDDTTSTSAQTVNCHIRDPQSSCNYIISPHIL